MALTPIDIATGIAAAALALSRMLQVVQPLWQKLPTWLIYFLPILVLNLPQIAAVVGVAKTGTELTVAIITSIAMLIPGLTAAPPKPGT